VPQENFPANIMPSKQSYRDIEMSRLEYQEKYSRELRIRNREKNSLAKQLAAVKAQVEQGRIDLANANSEMGQLQTELSDNNREANAAAVASADELAVVKQQLADKDRLNKTLVQELVESAEKLKQAETDHAVSAARTSLPPYSGNIFVLAIHICGVCRIKLGK
jgi:hydroxypyruvate isomerase